MELENYIKSNFTNEQKVFFQFLKEPGEENMFFEKKQNNKKITQLIERHRLVPFFFASKKNLHPELQEYIAQRFLKNSQRMLIFTSEVFLIHDTFLKNKLNPIFLKGPALAYELNNDPSTRQMVDLDVYVDKKELEKAHQCLLQLGYLPTEIPKTRLRKFMLKDNYYFHPEKKVPIEIHYRFFPNKYIDKKFNQLIPSLTKSFFVQNREVQVLSTEANLLFLILHGSNHQWFRLFWLKDLSDFITQKEINWPVIVKCSKNMGIEKVLVQSIFLTNLFFGTVVPDAIKELQKNNHIEHFMIKKAVKAIVYPINENFLTRIARLYYLLKISNKFEFKIHTLLGGLIRFVGK